MANGRGIRPKICKQCDALASDGHVISFRGLCQTCAIENQTWAARDLHNKSGPAFDRWVERMREVIGD